MKIVKILAPKKTLLSDIHYLAILGVNAFADAVDLLVDLGTVVVSLLTGTGHTVLNSARMPCSNTGNLTQTFVRLPGQFLAVPSGCYTCSEKLISLVHYQSTTTQSKSRELLTRDIRRKAAWCPSTEQFRLPWQGQIPCFYITHLFSIPVIS